MGRALGAGGRTKPPQAGLRGASVGLGLTRGASWGIQLGGHHGACTPRRGSERASEMPQHLSAAKGADWVPTSPRREARPDPQERTRTQLQAPWLGGLRGVRHANSALASAGARAAPEPGRSGLKRRRAAEGPVCRRVWAIVCRERQAPEGPCVRAGFIYGNSTAERAINSEGGG